MSAAIPEIVLIFAVCFNAILAILNGHGLVLQRGYVVSTEMAVYVAAVAVIFLNADRKMMPWFLLAFFIVLNGVLLSLGNGFFNPKYIRDVLVIPIFIMLGMTYRRESLVRPVVILQTIVFLIALLEALAPAVYSEIFQVLSYYVNTRDFSTGQFWNADSDLFVSATRPGDRFFGFVDWHRLSSIFLEPVSLGNYCVIVVIYLVASWRNLQIGVRYYLAFSTIVLLIGCDGRLAAASIAIVVMSSVIVRNVASRYAVAYLPAMLLAAALLVYNFNLDPRQDNFSGRVAGSMATLSSVDFSGLLGFDAWASDSAADSGITYFILTQSLVGVAVIWLCICVVPMGRSRATRLFIHGVAIFVPLNLMVSSSFFSVKVASLLWFCFGYFFENDALVSDRSRTPVPLFDVRSLELGPGT